MAEGIPELTSTQVYVGKADVLHHKARRSDIGRVKNVAVAQEAAGALNKLYGRIKNGEKRQTKIDNFLSSSTRNGRGFDPFHAEVTAKMHQQELSNIDELTGLFNLRHFKVQLSNRLQQAEHSGNPLGLINADQRNLKGINDTFGHDAGDKAIVRAVEGMKKGSRFTDELHRIGGDEYADLVPQISGDYPKDGLAGAAIRLLEHNYGKLIQGVDSTIRRHVTMPLRVDIGCTLSTPKDTPDTIKKRADNAMYLAKYLSGPFDKFVIIATSLSGGRTEYEKAFLDGNEIKYELITNAQEILLHKSK